MRRQRALPAGSAAAAALVLLACAALVAPQAVQDSRCYLTSGGAVESFYISEDTPVGSVIGTLSVNGSPRLVDGDIRLRVQESDAGLALTPGTKNLTLLRPLDREQRAGPASLYVNVRCERAATPDPSFVIPVSVRVWDVNDNAPVWAAPSYRLRLSELTAVGASLPLDLRASDADQPGPHATVHYRVLPGPHAEYFSFPNELQSSLVVAQPLDYESARELTLSLRASDAGEPPRHSDVTLTVDVLDADDQNPAFTYQHYTAVLPENATEGTELITEPGPISAADQDLGIKAPLFYTESGTGAGPGLLRLDRDTGRARATAQLLASLPATVVIRATQYDNADRYALATLRVTRAGARPGPATAAPVRFSRRAYHVLAREDTAPGALLHTLHTSRDPVHQPPLQFYVSERGFLDRFALNAAGELLLRKSLDYETQANYNYQVMVTDGITNDTASLNITVGNVNEWEPRFKYPQYEFAAPSIGDSGSSGASGDGLLPLGRLDAFDGDRGDTLALGLRGPQASMFYINASGELFVKAEALRDLNTSVLHVLATATDSGHPPRQSSVPVLVHVPSARAGGAGRGALLAGGAGLGALALLLAGTAYVCTHKRSKSTAVSQSDKPPGGSRGSKPPTLAPLAPPAGAAPPAALGAAPSGSLLSVSAGASTILAGSSSSLDVRQQEAAGHTLPHSGRQSSRLPSGKSRVAPCPPATSPAPACAPAGASATLMSDHVGGGARGRSGVAWPCATIPARVNKLSWDTDQSGSTELLQATNPALNEHMNLTVYF